MVYILFQSFFWVSPDGNKSCGCVSGCKKQLLIRHPHDDHQSGHDSNDEGESNVGDGHDVVGLEVKDRAENDWADEALKTDFIRLEKLTANKFQCR